MLRRSLFYMICVLLLTSCGGVDGRHFKLEGRFLHLNQGEFYVYDEAGDIDGFDTIKVEGGRFAYEMPCSQPSVIVMVFPNFSRQPIFTQPGKTVSIEGDASHLKELQVKGTDENELMTKFRHQIANASPPEIRKYVGQFVDDHPESAVGPYLVKEYFVTASNPDYQKAYRFVRMMLPKQPRNGQLARLERALKVLTRGGVGVQLPSFTAYDINGRRVSSADYTHGLAVISTFASWNYESMNLLRSVKQAQRKAGGRLKVVSLSVDASRFECRNMLRNDTITWPVVCDGTMFDNTVVRKLGLLSLSDNLLVKDGRIIARNLSTNDLIQQIEKNL